MRTQITFLAILWTSLLSIGQSTVELEIQLLTPDKLGEVTLDKEPFFAWIQEINQEVKDFLADEEGNKDVLVLITMHKDKDATIEIGSKTKLSDARLTDFSKALSKFESPNTLIVDYSFAIKAKINEGCSEDIEYSPKIIFPSEKKYLAYTNLELKDKKVTLEDWINNEVLPVLAAYETKVDPAFAGVLKVGEMVEQEKHLKTDIKKLTGFNPSYWRAVMEMNQGNQLIPFTKICMHISAGELDIAQRLLFVIAFFSDESTIPAMYHEILNAKLSDIKKEFNALVDEGIAFHDKGEYKKAVAHFEGLQKTFPKSAWLNYELYFSKAALEEDPVKAEKLWDKSKTFIYECDPLYHMSVHANNGKDGYLLLRRQESNLLFKDGDAFKTDVVKYADIALELEDYEFAGQLYWLIFTHLSEEQYDNRNILAHYLYCVDKLGYEDCVDNFKGDFPSEFKAIEKERLEIMESSPFYKAFKK